MLVAADGIANDNSRAFHTDDVYNPLDPADLEHRLDAAGFMSIDVGVHDLGWTCRARGAVSRPGTITG